MHFKRESVLNLAHQEATLVARSIHALKLPSYQPCISAAAAEELIRKLFEAFELRADGVLQALNTIQHDRFERLAWRLVIKDNPATSEPFSKHVLSRGEDCPRHAAALFLASHFSRLSAAQLVTLGDVLARNTPSATLGSNATRPPTQITDHVLDECGIRIAISPEEGASALIGLGDETGPREDPTRAAEVIRDLFERDAAQLKERYLLTLAQELTLGDASEKIYEEFQELELAALRSAAALDPAAAGERLVRLVFGHPAIKGERDLEANERQNLLERFDRLLVRFPGFLKALADRVPKLTANEAVAALCSASPATLDEPRQYFFWYGAANIFWGAYADGPPKLTLRAYPGLFDKFEQAGRCEALVKTLRGILDGETQHRALQELAARFKETALLRRLLADVGLLFHEMDDAGGFNVVLLVDAATHFIAASLKGRTWAEVAIEPATADSPLAEALLAPATAHWWREPGERIRGDEPDVLLTEARRLNRMVRAIVDGLVGSSSFEDTEDLAFDIWLIDAMGFDRTVENISIGYFHSRALWTGVLHDPNEDERDFLEVIKPILELFPLVVLMAATRTGVAADGLPVFTFTEPLGRFLTDTAPFSSGPPVKQLTAMIDSAAKFQQSWRNAHDNWYLAVSDRGKLVSAFRDRVGALRAFERTLRPLVEQCNRRQPSVRAQSATQPKGPTTAE
jgi:hypothetical protein